MLVQEAPAHTHPLTSGLARPMSKVFGKHASNLNLALDGAFQSALSVHGALGRFCL